jgi:hypothetical protein
LHAGISPWTWAYLLLARLLEMKLLKLLSLQRGDTISRIDRKTHSTRDSPNVEVHLILRWSPSQSRTLHALLWHPRLKGIARQHGQAGHTRRTSLCVRRTHHRLRILARTHGHGWSDLLLAPWNLVLLHHNPLVLLVVWEGNVGRVEHVHGLVGDVGLHGHLWLVHLSRILHEGGGVVHGEHGGCLAHGRVAEHVCANVTIHLGELEAG